MKRRNNKIDRTYCFNFYIVFELFAKQLKQNLAYLSNKICPIERKFKDFDDTLVLLGPPGPSGPPGRPYHHG